jgi:asparagine synthase (glutamine-hydrolysing)
MPGIAGIISRAPNQKFPLLVNAMVQSMKHEPFYRTGTHSAPEAGVHLGWAAFDQAVQPIASNQAGDITLLFCGECFLETEAANPEQLVRLYETSGPNFFGKLNGLFSGVLIDQNQHKAFLFNDRYGIQRLYYHEANGDFYFASEAKALLRVLPKRREFDPAGVAEFLALGCTLDWKTLFREIEMVPGGSVWVFENGRCRREKYFSPAMWEAQSQLSAPEFEAQFQETFRRILPRYFETDSKIGVALTGGLDTRMIMACRPAAGHRTTCYTFSGRHGETLDDQIAAHVAAASGLEHQLLRLNADFFSDFARHADQTVLVTDGCSGIAGAHEIYFNRQARRLAPTRLTGNYGSEVFRGISTFKPRLLAPELFDAEVRRDTEAQAQMFGGQQAATPSFSVFKEIPWNLFGNLAAGRSQVAFRTPYLDNDLVALAYRAPGQLAGSSLPAMRLVKAGNRRLSEIPTDRGFDGTNSGLRFLCRRVFSEVTFKLDYYHSEGLPRPLSACDPAFKFTLSKLKLSGRHKFLHYGNWFRHELADYLRQALAAPAVRQSRFWNAAFLKRLANEHIAGRKNHAAEINAVLTLAAVERLLFQDLPREI